MPLCLLREYIRSEVLGEADSQNLCECRTNRASGNCKKISFHPFLPSLNATFFINHFGNFKVVARFPNVVATLLVFNDFLESPKEILQERSTS